MSVCLSCPIKDGVILTQRLKIQSLEQEIIRLNGIIARGKATAAGIVSYSNRSMQEHQPRGTWSLLRGRKDAAIEIDQALR